ncbi:Nif3-like dinuclear metal center hexameric protein [Galbitalea sp. SE-J8]|uniref:Nif3-like dinuclear metal center hexameric protein n=1 Tax=Galbitalea sp. SE-J8 TaxID=3054952 RepID=UPI00259CC2C6|nr:Nif3-like dinuclear metal center hexameric protein [Galbitalea sp. SE-J8]MDM4761961.1 Nif3-like dinuclear metal center hexameric protein [Galbitalea sp. SE-J8]
MPFTVADVLAAVERLWPVAGAEGWDAPGLVSGDAAAEVHRIRLVVDVTADTVADALDAGADLVLAHHPLLLRGVTTVRESTYKGAMLARLIRGGVALLTAHTNADVVATGTSAVLARLIGLEATVPIVGSDSVGLGRVGALAQPVPLGGLAARIGEVLPATAGGIRVAGEYGREVRTVAVCAGAGDSLLEHPAVLGADAYVTADLRHHPASAAVELARLGAGPALVDVSHWASEWVWLAQAAVELRAELPGVDVAVSDVRTDPWDFSIVQASGEDHHR